MTAMQAIFSNPLFMPVVLTLAIVALVPLIAGYLTLVERKVLADSRCAWDPCAWGRTASFSPSPMP